MQSISYYHDWYGVASLEENTDGSADFVSTTSDGGTVTRNFPSLGHAQSVLFYDGWSVGEVK